MVPTPLSAVPKGLSFKWSQHLIGVTFYITQFLSRVYLLNGMNDTAVDLLGLWPFSHSDDT